MLSHARSQQAADDSVPDTRPRGVALVPLMPSARRLRVPYLQRSRADFVTQLIATAEHAPQTRHLRRATPADAEIAYKAQERAVPDAGVRTRHIV